MGKWRWGVILDAGSSGTRVHVYRWLNTSRARYDAKNEIQLNQLPQLHTKPGYSKKIKPGVSSFADRITDIGPEHLQSLLDHALSIVPENQVKDTPFFLMATAGVRLLEATKQKALINEICSYTKTHSDFYLSNCQLHVQVISGETEGLYGWIAANYLLKGFKTLDQETSGQRNHTYGFLDMGGASAQIAFEPNATETEKHANDLNLIRLRTLNGKMSEYKVFTATWLGFGVNQARQRYVKSLMDESYTKDAHELLDPCLPSGLKTSIDGIPVSDTHQGSALVGTGLFDECLRKTYPLLDKDAPCVDQPCLLHGQHVPVIDWNINQFVGVSEYWYTLHAVFETVSKSEKYNFNLYQQLVRDFCSEEWEDIISNVQEKKWGYDFDVKTAQGLCFKASWLMSVLHDGIGVPRNSLSELRPGFNDPTILTLYGNDARSLDPFQPINKIGNMEVSWTVGKMLLYAAGQIPPSDSQGLPVGIGPNNGEPGSFQEAGSNFEVIPEIKDEDSWTEAAEELAEKAHSRSTHGIILFLLFFLIIGYIFRKRDRRLRISRIVRRTRRSSSPPRGNRGFFCASSKYFGPLSVINYDKILDDEVVSADFELGDAEIDDNEHSDSSRRSRIGRTSGRATSKANGIKMDSTNHYFDGSSAGPRVRIEIN
ncbi:Golgi apyrase [Erysiphe necator]|nr:Golgi apyrase [Erysiphe necator]